MKRTCILTLVAVFGLTFFEGTASATPTAGKAMPYVEIGSGSISSTTNDVTTSVARRLAHRSIEVTRLVQSRRPVLRHLRFRGQQFSNGLGHHDGVRR
jgi:hypothetical protein